MNHGARVRLRGLVALTLAVCAVHWLALRGLPERIAPGRAAAPSFVVRVASTPAIAPAAASAAARTQAATTAPPPQRALPRTRPAAAAAPGTQQKDPVPAPARPLHAVTVPGAARWQYAVTAMWRGLHVPGRAELAWQHDGHRYEAVLQIAVQGLPQRVQRSTGDLTLEGLAPVRFSERHRGEEATHFQRDRQRIVFSSNRPEAALLRGAQDRLSVLLQLAAIVAGDAARFTEGTRIVLQTAGTREAAEWEFVSDGEEELALSGGTVRVLKFSRAPRHEYDNRLEAWIGLGADYGPVRLRLTPPNGDWLDMQWSGTDKG